MGSRIQILAVTASVLVILMVIHLIRHKRLRVEYSIVWLFGCAMLFLFSIWRGLLDILAGYLGVYYAPAVLLLIAIFFAALGFLHFSVAMSRQAECSKQLVQEVALLKLRLESLSRPDKPHEAGGEHPRS